MVCGPNLWFIWSLRQVYLNTQLSATSIALAAARKQGKTRNLLLHTCKCCDPWRLWCHLSTVPGCLLLSRNPGGSFVEAVSGHVFVFKARPTILLTTGLCPNDFRAHALAAQVVVETIDPVRRVQDGQVWASWPREAISATHLASQLLLHGPTRTWAGSKDTS